MIGRKRNLNKPLDEDVGQTNGDNLPVFPPHKFGSYIFHQQEDLVAVWKNIVLPI